MAGGKQIEIRVADAPDDGFIARELHHQPFGHVGAIEHLHGTIGGLDRGD
jgi:hypothetical protein